MSDVNTLVVEPLKKFVKDSTYLVKKCTKPDHKGMLQQMTLEFQVNCIEFAKIAKATGIGFLIMGFIGFFVKLVHIPINNIIVGGM